MEVITREQPQFTAEALNKVEVSGDSSEPRSVTVRGHWDDILIDRDCKTPGQAFLMFKAEDSEDWSEEELDILDDNFTKKVELAEYCKGHHFKLRVVGYPSSSDVMTDTKLFSPEEDHLSMADIPPVRDLAVTTSGDRAEISWSQSSCLPGFQFLVSRGDSCGATCLDTNEKKEIGPDDVEDNEAGVELDVVYHSKEVKGGRLMIYDLSKCTDYVVMVRLVGQSGRLGPVTSQVFTPSNQNQVFASQKWLPRVEELKIIPGELTGPDVSELRYYTFNVEVWRL